MIYWLFGRGALEIFSNSGRLGDYFISGINIDINRVEAV